MLMEDQTGTIEAGMRADIAHLGTATSTLADQTQSINRLSKDNVELK
jgi:hypothetical protein